MIPPTVITQKTLDDMEIRCENCLSEFLRNFRGTKNVFHLMRYGLVSIVYPTDYGTLETHKFCSNKCALLWLDKKKMK